MPNQSTSAGKAFYILLCAIMGALLFLVIQRAAALIYYLLLSTNFGVYSLGMSYFQLLWLNFLTILAALFFGLWYGIWLGLHWFDIVYEQGQGGLFRGFRGHWPRRQHPDSVFKKLAPSSAPVTVKPTVAAAPPGSTTIKPVLRTEPSPPNVFTRLSDRLQKDSWDFDDLKPSQVAPPKAEKSNGKTAAKRKASAKRSPSSAA